MLPSKANSCIAKTVFKNVEDIVPSHCGMPSRISGQIYIGGLPFEDKIAQTGTHEVTPAKKTHGGPSELLNHAFVPRRRKCKFQ